MKFPLVKPITNEDFKEDGNEEFSIAILKCFPFSSELQRQSVIVRSSIKKRPQLFLKVFFYRSVRKVVAKLNTN